MPGSRLSNLKKRIADADETQKTSDAKIFKKISERSDHHISAKKSLPFRLIVASVILFFALVLPIPGGIAAVILILASLIAGFDVILSAINNIRVKNFFDSSIILLLTVPVGFILGYGAESAAAVILFEIGLLLISYTKDKTAKSALELIPESSEKIISAYSSACPYPGNDSLFISRKAEKSAVAVLKISAVVAVLYAILLPVITDFSLRVSIHRAITIILVANPLSVTAGLSSVGRVALGAAAGKGFVFKNARLLERLANAKTLVFDAGDSSVSSGKRIVSVHSSMVEKDTFLNLVYHLVHESNQDFARIIRDYCQFDYLSGTIIDFRDIDGFGVEGKINSMPVLFGTGGFIRSRGIETPEVFDDGTYFLAVSGKCAGEILFSSGSRIQTDYAGIINALDDDGSMKFYLISGRNSTVNAPFDEVFNAFRKEEKLSILDNLCASLRSGSVYISPFKNYKHSAASVDIHASESYEDEDAVVFPDKVNNYPAAVEISRRMQKIAKQNILFTLSVKGLLIFLSVIGYCNLWFAVYIDMAAALATILNAIRVSTK